MKSIKIFSIKVNHFLGLLKGIKPILSMASLIPTPSSHLTLYRAGAGWRLDVSSYDPRWGWEGKTVGDVEQLVYSYGGDSSEVEVISYRLTPSVFLGILGLLDDASSPPWESIALVAVGDEGICVCERSIIGVGVERLLEGMNSGNGLYLETRFLSHPPIKLIGRVGLGVPLGEIEPLKLEQDLSAVSFINGDKKISVEEIKKILKNNTGSKAVFYSAKMVLAATKATGRGNERITISEGNGGLLFHSKEEVETFYAVKAWD